MRRRFARCFEEYSPKFDEQKLGKYLEKKLGIAVLSGRSLGYELNWVSFCDRSNLIDILNILAPFFEYCFLEKREDIRKSLKTEITRIISEECIRIEIDESGNITPRFDAELSKSRQSTIRSLGSEKFNSVKKYLEKVDDALLGTPIDGRTAIRSAYDAVENLIKQKFSKATALNKQCINDRIKPFLQSEYEGQGSEQNTVLKILAGLEGWVNACHFYRHTDGEPEIKQPSEATTLALVSQGYTYTRWLVEVLKL